MICPAQQEVMKDTLANGIWADKRAMVEDPAGVTALMKSCNLDQSTALSVHEMSFLFRAFECAHANSVGDTQDHWQMVAHKVSEDFTALFTSDGMSHKTLLSCSQDIR